MRIIDFTISKKDEGKRIRDFLRAFGVSSSLLTKLKNTPQGILLNGSAARTIDTLKAEDKLRICIKNSGAMPSPLSDSRVKMIYSDDDILVLDKPAMMPVHESRNHQGDTLANAAAMYMESDTAFRCVYRLDRDTSGLVLIAKNELAACKLAGKIEKDYYAVCEGILINSGVIDVPIRREADSIIKRIAAANGDNAVTRWQALSQGDNCTLLKIHLDTGRTHQIRVHFAHIGHPLIGDSLYGKSDENMSRQALHCKTIRFCHPVSEKIITIDCDFPTDFKGLIKCRHL